jgi:hypothetical protein
MLRIILGSNHPRDLGFVAFLHRFASAHNHRIYCDRRIGGEPPQGKTTRSTEAMPRVDGTGPRLSRATLELGGEASAILLARIRPKRMTTVVAAGENNFHFSPNVNY